MPQTPLEKDIEFINARIKILESNADSHTYLIDGKRYRRIPFGKEQVDWGTNPERCGDCGVSIGELHKPECDIQVCPRCRRQAIFCPCHYQRNTVRS